MGFGTYKLQGNACFSATQAAINAGYRHIDTAMVYDNEAAVGRAIAASGSDRADLFLTSKVKGYPDYLTESGCKSAVRDSFERLGSAPIDLLLVHWWNPQSDMAETFSALNDLRDDGYIRHIGVSNFSPSQLREAIAASDSPILTNQIEYHPYRNRNELLRVCHEEGVLVTAYSPLAAGALVDDPLLTSIGDHHGKSAPQIAIRWLIQQEGVLTIPKASSAEHIQENAAVFDFNLSPDEMQRIRDLRGPLAYRLTADDGAITKARHRLGGIIPAPIRRSVPF